MPTEGFPKQERIVSKKRIDMLFGSGQSHSLAAFPLRAVYTLTGQAEGDTALQLLISVPKRRFKHAVDRNRVKRQLREAFRHHKQQLAQAVPQGKVLLLAFIWLADDHRPTAEVEKRAVSLMRKIGREIEK